MLGYADVDAVFRLYRYIALQNDPRTGEGPLQSAFHHTRQSL
jgi:hypothetical protein